jgi:NADH-quinone oxidoreductase subunit L
MFHLITHACFKALLFLAAGSVIVAMHHKQDMRHMGGLRRYMPITYITFLIGALALSAIPPFSGFFSKDAIIEAASHSLIPGAGYAYYCLLLGSFVTALYIFRAFFYTFHGKPRFDDQVKSHLKESPAVMTLPLIILAIPAAILGLVTVHPFLYGGFLNQAINVHASHNVLAQITQYSSAWYESLNAVFSWPFWFALAGIIVAWLSYVVYPWIPNDLYRRSQIIHSILINKYGFDDFNQLVLVRGTRALARGCSRIGDDWLIDHGIVNGLGRLVNRLSNYARSLQSGYIYHYAFTLIAGLFVFMLWFLV